MNNDLSGNLKPIQHPKAWKYIFLFAFACAITILIWRVTHAPISSLDTSSNEEAMMSKLSWVGIPLVVSGFVLSGHYLMAAQKALTRENMIRLQVEQASKPAPPPVDHAKERREYVLEILGMGVTLDEYRQGKLWDAVQKGNSYTTIREQNPRKYAWTDTDKLGIGGGRVCDAFENGAERTPMYWGLPSFEAGGPNQNPTMHFGPTNPMIGAAASFQATGMAWHLSIAGPWLLDERPDRLLEQVFSIFDQYPDLPYIVLTAEDDASSREDFLPPGSPLRTQTGYYVPKMPDAAAVFVLARRERVEPLRDFVWEDPDNDFVQEEFRTMYFKLIKTVPTDKKDEGMGRTPTIAEWLPAAAAFAKNPEIHPEGHHKYFINFKPYKNSPPKSWKPTPWFPIPWNEEQMETFDKLPSLGFLHRPTFVKFIDQEGHPIKHREERQKVLQAGWQEALQTLPDDERAKGPSRIAAGTNNNGEQLVALEQMLHHYAAAGGPVIDTGKTEQFINTDRRLGNTGAASFFMQMALGVIGSYREGGVSVAINLRDPNEASIIFISPPSDEKRKSQGEPFGSHVEPAFDPKNYETPSVESLIEAQRKHESDAQPASSTVAKR